MLQGFAAVNKRLSSGGVLTGYVFLIFILIKPHGYFKNYIRKELNLSFVSDIKAIG